MLSKPSRSPSTDGKKFTVVYRGSTTSETGLQSFTFPSPVEATQVEFLARSNWGGTSGVSVAELEVVGFRHTSSSGSTAGTSLLDGGWTYHPDTQTLVMLFGSPGGSGPTRLRSLMVNNLPAVNAVTYINVGFVTVHPITPRATLLPARKITLPTSQQFGFSVSPQFQPPRSPTKPCIQPSSTPPPACRRYVCGRRHAGEAG